MFKLIKNEIEYFKIPLLAILFLLSMFTLFALYDIELFSDVEFLKKYLWSMIIGLGSYGLVFILWSQRVKENHERMIYSLPIKINSKRWSRWIFAILPFVFVMVYIQILHFMLSGDWTLHVGRISAQVGFLSMALAGIFIVRDFWFVKQNKGHGYKIFSGSVIFIIAVLGEIVINRIYSYNIITPFYIHQEELMFFTWSILFSSFSLVLYSKRKSYLE
ncbi:MAG: hypothetical protein R3250_04275 [Melioribacteraceae bacterium]|nr:hypothetical protein [Melioribacteraceae bacterium]